MHCNPRLREFLALRIAGNGSFEPPYGNAAQARNRKSEAGSLPHPEFVEIRGGFPNGVDNVFVVIVDEVGSRLVEPLDEIAQLMLADEGEAVGHDSVSSNPHATNMRINSATVLRSRAASVQSS